MKKSVKVALKRFAVLLLCLLMVVPLFAMGDKLDKGVKIGVGVGCLVIIVIYWIYAFIVIRREDQRKNRNENEK